VRGARDLVGAETGDLLVDAADQESVLVAHRGQQPNLGATAGYQRVQPNGRAVDEARGGGEERSELQPERRGRLLEGRAHAVGRRVGRGQRLLGGDRAVSRDHDAVDEGPARVDTDGTLRRYARAHTYGVVRNSLVKSCSGLRSVRTS